MYAEFEVHRTMIRDRVRTEAFRRAIDSVVHPGDIVLDAGAGSGILSVFAAQAGAARVYAVEQTSVAVLAQELAAAQALVADLHPASIATFDADRLLDYRARRPVMHLRDGVNTALTWLGAGARPGLCS
jgi:predicted RNA methylase